MCGDTTGLWDGNDLSATCGGSNKPWGLYAGDQTWAFVPNGAGQVTLTVTPQDDWDALVYVSDQCAKDRCVVAANGAGAGQAEVLTFVAELGKTYFIVVDGWSIDPYSTHKHGEYWIQATQP